MTADRYAVALQRVVRDDWSRLASSLVGQFRRIDLVEDALGDAVEAAARTWPRDGIPERPSAWVLTAARRVILDRLRAEAMHCRRRPLLVSDALMYAERTTSRADPGDLVDDDRLRLVLMCTHPALDPDAAAALALRLVLGVSTRDVARLFLVSEPTMAARITRAKRKIVSAAIPFTIPPLHALPGRVETAAGVAYLAFTAGYAPASGSDLVRSEIAGEAIRLVRVMLDLRPGEPVLVALLALMLLQHSRRDARVGPDGELVLLPDQDRSRWQRDEIDEGLALLASLEKACPGGAGEVPAVSRQTAAYAVQAGIAAEHARAAEAGDTRWDRIVRLYDALVDLGAGPSAELGRVVAIAEAHSPRAALDLLAAIPLPGSHRVPAVRAQLLQRCGDAEGARAAYLEAIALCHNETELTFLRNRVAELADPD